MVYIVHILYESSYTIYEWDTVEICGILWESILSGDCSIKSEWSGIVIIMRYISSMWTIGDYLGFYGLLINVTFMENGTRNADFLVIVIEWEYTH